MTDTRLEHFLANAAERCPDRTAVIDPGFGDITYTELLELAQDIAEALQNNGVQKNDRVGICAPKSIGTVASIFAILRCKACYVPVDPNAPPKRSAFIFKDCSVKGILVHRPLLEPLQAELIGHGLDMSHYRALPTPAKAGLDLVLVVPHNENTASPVADQELAYILYTSGSTGKPKGVIHSHATSLSFVDWCSQEFNPTENDRFSSHAPFHFDLSILDLFVSIKHRATLVLIGETEGKQPHVLAPLIADHKITVWYSTPSILRLLVEYGKIDTLDFSSLRLILYAGEVFPLKHLKALYHLLPEPSYYNLYGPTETNVCTFCCIPLPPPDDETLPQLIGKVCSADRLKVVNDSGDEVPTNNEGELWATGGSVFLGYWNLPEQDAKAFITDESGTRWYKTGDLVIDQGDGNFLFLGRKDRMVKRRGFRVELGEIESILYSHDNISEAAVVAVPDSESGVQLRAFVKWAGSQAPSVLELKRFSTQNLLSYMVPDRFVFLEVLPKTSTDKIDYQRLKDM